MTMEHQREGTYISNQTKNACMSYNLKTLHILFELLQEKSSMESNKIVDKERIIELIITENHGCDPETGRK